MGANSGAISVWSTSPTAIVIDVPAPFTGSRVVRNEPAANDSLAARYSARAEGSLRSASSSATAAAGATADVTGTETMYSPGSTSAIR